MDRLKVLKVQLADIHVFKVGQTEIDIYVIGRTADGKWAGTKNDVSGDMTWINFGRLYGLTQ